MSILKPWESTYQKAIGYYVEYSLWAPIGLLLLYIASVAGTSANAAFGSVVSELPLIQTILSLVKSLLVMIIKAVFMAVAIFAFMQIPQIANKALALGSPIEDVHHGAGQVPRNAAQAGRNAGQAIAKALTKS